MSNGRTILVLTAAMMLAGVSLRAQTAPGGSASFPVKSPVAIFRDLLAMSPQQRSDAIALRPPDIQKRILEKLNEYELLPPDLRELRLRETELRWFLRPLMDEPRENRAAALLRVPLEFRARVQDRLQMWDLLPPDLQKQFKDNDLIASYFAQGAVTKEQRDDILRQIPVEQRDELGKGLERWKAMSIDERQKTLAGFNRFFELTPEQKEKTLDTMSDEERRQIEQTLASYGKLTPQQRAQCVKSFQTFASMNAAERQQFLKNAKLWSEMTPAERERWRQLVTIAPMLPPEIFPPPPASTNGTSLREPTAMAAN